MVSSLGQRPAREVSQVVDDQIAALFLDGRLITETAESAYKAKRQARVPLLAGSNSADTAGNR